MTEEELNREAIKKLRENCLGEGLSPSKIIMIIEQDTILINDLLKKENPNVEIRLERMGSDLIWEARADVKINGMQQIVVTRSTRGPLETLCGLQKFLKDNNAETELKF
jgi:hypothetical protein